MGQDDLQINIFQSIFRGNLLNQGEVWRKVRHFRLANTCFCNKLLKL